MAIVNSPHCIALKAAYEDDRSLYLVMELARHGDLYANVMRRRRRFTEVEAAHIFKQVLLALADVHRHGFVHRDVKVLNVLMTDVRSLTVKLGDFGLACAIGNADDYEQCGTHCYMSPETLAHKRVGYPVDMWATGVMLYEVICGKRPFCSEDEISEHHHEAVFDVNRPEPVFTQPVFTRKQPSPLLVDFMRGLLEPMPRRRLSAVEALDHNFITRADRPGYDPRSARFKNDDAAAEVATTADDRENDDDDDDDDDDTDDEYRAEDDAESVRRRGEAAGGSDDEEDEEDGDEYEPSCPVCKEPFGKLTCVSCTVCDETVHAKCTQVADALHPCVCKRCRCEPLTDDALVASEADDDGDEASKPPQQPKMVQPHRTRPRSRRLRSAAAATVPSDAKLADAISIDSIDELPPSGTSTDADAEDCDDDEDDGHHSSLESEDYSMPEWFSEQLRHTSAGDRFLPPPPPPPSVWDSPPRAAVVQPSKAQRFAILNRNERSFARHAGAAGEPARPRKSADDDDDEFNSTASGVAEPDNQSNEKVTRSGRQRKNAAAPQSWVRPVDGFSADVQTCVANALRPHSRGKRPDARLEHLVKAAAGGWKFSQLTTTERALFTKRCLEYFRVLTTRVLTDLSSDSESAAQAATTTAAATTTTTTAAAAATASAERRTRHKRQSSLRAVEAIKTIALDDAEDDEPSVPPGKRLRSQQSPKISPSLASHETAQRRSQRVKKL
jgi:hypothetical protein